MKIFLQKSSIIDVWQVPKDASSHRSLLEAFMKYFEALQKGTEKCWEVNFFFTPLGQETEIKNKN